MSINVSDINKLPIEDVIAKMQECDELSEKLADRLAIYAQLQEYTEKLFNELVQIAREGIGFVNEVHAGDHFSAEWIAKREKIVAEVHSVLERMPITE